MRVLDGKRYSTHKIPIKAARKSDPNQKGRCERLQAPCAMVSAKKDILRCKASDSNESCCQKYQNDPHNPTGNSSCNHSIIALDLRFRVKMGVDHENRVPHDRYVHNDCDDADRTSVAPKSFGIQDAEFSGKPLQQMFCSDSKTTRCVPVITIVNHVKPSIPATVGSGRLHIVVKLSFGIEYPKPCMGLSSTRDIGLGSVHVPVKPAVVRHLS